MRVPSLEVACRGIYWFLNRTLCAVASAHGFVSEESGVDALVVLNVDAVLFR